MDKKREKAQFYQSKTKKETASVNELLRYANKNNTIPFDWSKLNK